MTSTLWVELGSASLFLFWLTGVKGGGDVLLDFTWYGVGATSLLLTGGAEACVGGFLSHAAWVPLARGRAPCSWSPPSVGLMDGGGGVLSALLPSDSGLDP